jgi:hypothetical protein
VEILTAWKNDSNAYSLPPVYGSIEDAIRAASQKWMTKNKETAVLQTRKFMAEAAPGTYLFHYPFVILEIVEENPSLSISAYDGNIVTVIKE